MLYAVAACAAFVLYAGNTRSKAAISISFLCQADVTVRGGFTLSEPRDFSPSCVCACVLYVCACPCPRLPNHTGLVARSLSCSDITRAWCGSFGSWGCSPCNWPCPGYSLASSPTWRQIRRVHRTESCLMYTLYMLWDDPAPSPVLNGAPRGYAYLFIGRNFYFSG